MRALLLICLLLSALPWRAEPAHADEPRVLTVVSPHWEGIRNEFSRAFGKECLRRFDEPCEVRWLDLGGTVEILRFLRSQFQVKPDGVDIDILFGGGIDPYLELKRLGYLEPHRLPDAVLQGIPADAGGTPLYDDGFHWYAATLAGFGIVYNKQVLALLDVPPPRSWRDLTDQRLFSWVASADPGKSGAAHMFYELILQGYGWPEGWAVIFDLAANIPGFGNTAGQVTRDVLHGEAAAGFALDSYAREAIAQGGAERIGFVIPEEASAVLADGIGILRGAPKPELARAFIEFVLSDEGQRLWLLPRGEPGGPEHYYLGKLSVRPGLYQGDALEALNPFMRKGRFRYDSELGAARRPLVSDLLTVFVVNRHDALKAAARASVSPGALLPPPVSEDELMQLRTAPSGQAERNRRIAQWTREGFSQLSEYGAQGSVFYQALPSLLLLLLVTGGAYRKRRARR